MVTNCKTERSFSQMKRIENPKRTTMRQERMEFLSLLMIEAELLRQIIFGFNQTHFANKKCRRKLFKV
jgi:DNA (cytosine-5)-methyltransferase 1